MLPTELGSAMKFIHEIELKVRDYECDQQAVVNNGVYMNYLEHARHELLLSRGIDFSEVTRAGINLVVVRAELDYRESLTSGDRFVVRSKVERRSRLRFDFVQHIFRRPDERLMLEATITGTALNPRGRPFVAEMLEVLFEQT